MPLSEPLLEEIKLGYVIVAECRDILTSTEKQFKAFENIRDFVEDIEIGPAITRAKDRAQLALDTLMVQLAKLP